MRFDLSKFNWLCPNMFAYLGGEAGMVSSIGGVFYRKCFITRDRTKQFGNRKRLGNRSHEATRAPELGLDREGGSTA